MSGIAVPHASVRPHHAVEHRREARGDAAPRERFVDALHGGAGRVVAVGVHRQYALDDGGEQRRRRALPRDVADDEARRAVRALEVVEEVAADRAAGNRERGDVDRAALTAPRGQERALDLGGDAHVALELRAVEDLAIEARARRRRHGVAGELHQEAAEVVRAPLVHDPAAGDGEEEHRRHADAFAGRRKAEEAARIGAVNRQREDHAAVGDQELARLDREVGKRLERQARDPLHAVAALHRAADRALDDAVVGVERAERRGIEPLVRAADAVEQGADLVGGHALSPARP